MVLEMFSSFNFSVRISSFLASSTCPSSSGSGSLCLLLLLLPHDISIPLHSSLLGHSRVSCLVVGGLSLALVLLGGFLPSEVPLVASGHGAVSQQQGYFQRGKNSI